MAMAMASQQYVEWQELMVSKEKGRREVQYLLKRRDSDSWDLGVVGKERTQRHMSYRYAIPDRNPSWPKLKSRRDVLDWISSIVSDLPSHSSLPSLDSNSLDADGSLGKEIAASKNLFMPNLRKFMWLGSSQTCNKQRSHYRAFRRNGIEIYLHDFVYILSEDNKRLVAHLEDLYEDSRGNKMVVVRWFHKIDEVGLVLPPNFNVREIFFSLCLQDISVECIDGVAAILNPQHYKKYVSDARHSSWDPFLCHRLFHEDNLSAFDITHVQGYWKQEILRWMFTDPPDNQLIPNITGNSCADGDDDEAINNRALKRLRKAKARDPVQLMNEKKDATEAGHEEKKLFCNGVGNCEAELSGLKNVKFCIGLSEKKKIKKMTNEKLAINCHVEVLSQDSGIRGCWFRALVLKRHKDKVKVRYQDIKDAEDEANCLEEWILSSKIAVPNGLGIWNHRRATVRPEPSCRKGSVSLDLVDSGSIVDAWWNDGWWEGIVVRKESKDKIHVYFPGEKKFSIFGCGELRLSQDWVLNQWNLVKGRPDLVSSILSGLQTSQAAVGNSVEHLTTENGQCGSLSAASTGDKKTPGGETSNFSESQKCQPQPQSQSQSQSPSQAGTSAAKVNGAPDLAKEGFLSQINWNACRKRRSNWDSYPRRNKASPNSDNRSGSADIGQEEDATTSAHGRARYLINADLAKCNYIGDSLLSPSMPLVASLVMSR